MSSGIGRLRESLLWCEARARMAMLILSLLLMAGLSPGAVSIGWAQNLLETDPATRELDREQKSYWRSLVTNLTLIEVDSLHEVVQEMQDEGGITNYEFLVRDRGADYEVLIQAEIVDVFRWAAVKGLKVENVSIGFVDHEEARLGEDTTRQQPRAAGPDLRQIDRRLP